MATEMLPISVWWFLLDLPTRTLIYTNPLLPLSPDLAARILEAGGVLYEAGFFPGTGTPGYEVLPDDIAWIQRFNDTL